MNAFINRLLVAGKICKALYWSFWMTIPIMFIGFFGYLYYVYYDNSNDVCIFIISSIYQLHIISMASHWIFDTAMITIMCDKKISGTHFATLSTVVNLGIRTPYILCLFLLEYISYELFSVINLILCVVFLMVSKNLFYSFDNA